MKRPEFPEAIRIFIEPKRGGLVARDGFAWSVEGLRSGTSHWRYYGLFWASGLHDMDVYRGWKPTYEKAEARARKEVADICQYQCRKKAAYEKWLAGYVTIDVECDDC